MKAKHQRTSVRDTRQYSNANKLGQYSRSSRSQARYKRAQRRKIKRLVTIAIFLLLVAGVLAYFIPQWFSQAQTQIMHTDNIVIALHGDENTQVLKGESYIESGAHAIDKSEGNVNVETSGNVDTSDTGEYTVTYTAKNSKGETNTRDRKVKVVDKMDVPEENIGIPVLMYHWVYEDSNPPAENSSNFISTSHLEEQLAWLKKENFYFPSYQELRAYIEGKHSLPKRSAILTFDDGEAGFFKYGKSLFEKHKVPVTSFFIGNTDNATEVLKANASEYIDFQSHTYALHCNGTSGKGHGGKIFDLNKEQQVNDFKKAASVVGANDALAYPFGDYSDDSPAAIQEAGILCAFTVNPGFCKHGMDCTHLPRVRILGNQSLESYAATLE